MTASRHVDLRSQQNPACIKCTREERDGWTDGGTCSRVTSIHDGQAVRCVGDWAYDKIFHLYQYMGIFASGMKNAWPGLNYVEICSGPGRCILKETGEEIDGSALAIINHAGFQHIDNALFIDSDADAVNVLNGRIGTLGLGSKANAAVGDYTDADGIVKLIGALPEKRLNLVFVDPTDCSVPFSTIEAIIKNLKNVDLIINVPVYMDAGRNLADATLKDSHGKCRAKYADALGDADFFTRSDVIEMATSRNHRGLRTAFRDSYRNGLEQCGHEHIGERTIRDLYELMFASGHPKGLDFWDKACNIAPDGQRQLL